MAAQNNTYKTNYVKAKIYYTQQNSKCRLCGDGDKTINHIISECSKLVPKKFKTRHEWVGKVIPSELCKKLKLDDTAKWYMHKPEPVLGNETNKKKKRKERQVLGPCQMEYEGDSDTIYQPLRSGRIWHKVNF